MPRLVQPFPKIVAAFLFFSLVSLAAERFELPFRKWRRASRAPVLAPQGTGFDSAGVFNPAVILKDGEFVMLYRAQNTQGTSSLGYATSRNGIHFIRREEPVLTAQAPYEKGGGVEDPRLVQIDDVYVLTYTGYNNVDGRGPERKDAQLCLATSHDLIHWERAGVILPAYQGRWNAGWTKSGAIVPERIGGKYWMYYLGTDGKRLDQMGVASSEDLIHWADATDQPVLQTRPGRFDSRVVEPGPPPVILGDGIFLIYNAADNRLVYRTGWALFDKTDPRHVLARSDQPIFQPERPWEKIGQVPNVIFVEGLVRESYRWLFYYGGADKYVGVTIAPGR
jgi:predicted GH43/DUF377 family glycosyl hydrolase